ncbi:H(+)/Cl(-) exchange transporter ClcA [Thermincola ferriacetica]|uniref:H(+)/Cl(-) exchange transporter ClcA n=1 Tax=Thermincola ferriacetica TaxID=281456 RepID=A0A0L6W0M6_9FIRM|nr:H(+)/Cl(-) exchange transporter ClcA [Thermincola ferriacetica]KNZ68928.1 H(+)/Cl(-) exchange transporter ClcA [Thermincola ferriacetica]
MGKSRTYRVLSHWWDFRLKLFVEGILSGIVAGLLVVFFRFMLEKAEVLRDYIYPVLQNNAWWPKAVFFLTLIVIAFLLGKIVRYEPMAAGSGIPQVEGYLSGQLTMNWWKVIPAKLAGGIMAIGSGLSLGREGPSIQLGAAAGQGVSRALRRLRVEEKYLVTSGASAGLAAAFNAPLAGVIFALEEVHKNFSSVVLTAAMAASLTADLVSQNFFGQKPIFHFHDLQVLPLKYYFLLVVLGVIAGVFGVFFNRSLVFTLNMYGKVKVVPEIVKPLLPLMAGGVLGFYLPETLGGGHRLIDSLGSGHYSLIMLFALLAVKFAFTMLSYGSGVPGGIFLPLLVIGALTGDIFGSIAVNLFHINPQYLNNFIVLAMAAYFTAIVKAPVTGSVLITEMTGSFSHLLALITVSMTSYMVVTLLRSEPVYELLLKRILQNRDNAPHQDRGTKIILEIPVCLGALVAGRMVKEVEWPQNCLLVGLKRGETEIIPRGHVEILPGDYLIVLTEGDRTVEVKAALEKLAGETEM